MLKATVDHKIISTLSQLGPGQKNKVLAYIQSLLTPGEKKDIIKFAGIFDPEELKQMEQIIQEGCENIDKNEW